MDYTSLLTSQLTDLFRVGLLVGLFYTMERTKPQTGIAIPLLAGIAFVAVIIPSTMPVTGVSFSDALVTGLVANSLIVAVLWLIFGFLKKRS